jgi:ketosteroid isomerase-like protein
MTAEETAAALDAYLGDEGIERVAQDAVYREMGTGEEWRGREAIAGTLDRLYTELYDARADERHRVIGAGTATIEYDFRGRRQADGADVSIPLCVVYELAGGQIQAARIYFLEPETA